MNTRKIGGGKMLPRVGLFGILTSSQKAHSNGESVNQDSFDKYLYESVQHLNLNAEKVFERYEKPLYDFFASKGRPVTGMVFTLGKGIIPRWEKGYSNVYVRMVINGKLIEFTGLKSQEDGRYAYQDVRIKEIPSWWKWSTEHLVVSRISDKNMGYFLDFKSGVEGVTEFMGVKIERKPYEALDYIADALDFLHEQGKDVKEYAMKIYKEIMDSGEEESISALKKWLSENQERLRRWGIDKTT